MQGLDKALLLKIAGKICKIAITFAAVAPMCCRGNFYEPDEPEGLAEFINNP